jgi:4-amino-4-deoxy-L-arabinose transferase-like glycosyltransferase
LDAFVDRTTDPRGWSIRRGRSIEIAAVVGILVVVAIAAVWLIGQAIPLGWDESVYASKSRSLVTDIPSSTWAIYRAPGLPVVGLLGGAFGFTDANLRAVALLFNLGALAMAWALARMLWGPLAAIVALLTIAGSPVVIAEIALFHTDLPSAGLLLALMLLVWHEFERRPEPSRLLIAAAPLAALAFYVRYGSILPIGGIGIAAAVLWHRSMLRNKGLLGLTVALAALLFAPHIFESISRTGSPLGIMTSAGEQVDTSEPVATAARYLGWLPSQLAHRVGFVVMLAGVAHGAIVALDAIRRREVGPVARRYVWLFVPAGVTTLGLILQSHPEQRYVLFPVLLAIIAGGGAVSAANAWLRARRGLAERQHAFDGAIVVGLLLIAVIAGSVGARRLVVLEREGDESRWLPAVGEAIDADADGPCATTTSVPPIVEWYSHCRSEQFSGGGADALDAGGSPDPTYIVFSSIDERRASPRTLQLYRALLESGTATSIPTGTAAPGVEVYRFTR